MIKAKFIITVEKDEVITSRPKVTIESEGDTYIFGLWRFACEYFMSMVVKKSGLNPEMVLQGLCNGSKMYDDKVIRLPERGD